MTPSLSIRLAIFGLVVAAPSWAKTDDEPCPAPESFVVLDEIKDHVGLPGFQEFDLPFEEGDIEKVCSERLCLWHNPRTKEPVVVIQKMNRSVVCGDNPRPDKWSKEDRVSEETPVALNRDYTNSGFARGHQAASADFQSDLSHMKDTFYFSNAVPQIQDGFNGSYWRFLEDHIQDLAMNGHEMIVMTGPVQFEDDGKEQVVTEAQNACELEIKLPGVDKHGKASICNANDEVTNATCAAGVAVPAGLFKIVYLIESDKAFAFLMGNYDHRETHDQDHIDLDNFEYIDLHRVSVDEIEKLTNIDFFTRQSSRREEIIEEGCIATPMH